MLLSLQLQVTLLLLPYVLLPGPFSQEAWLVHHPPTLRFSWALQSWLYHGLLCTCWDPDLETYPCFSSTFSFPSGVRGHSVFF